MTKTSLGHQSKLPSHREEQLNKPGVMQQEGPTFDAKEIEQIRLQTPYQGPPKWVLIWISLVSACGEEKENVENFESDWWPWALKTFHDRQWAKHTRKRAILWASGQIVRLFIETVLTKTASFIRSIRKTAD